MRRCSELIKRLHSGENLATLGASFVTQLVL